MVHRTLICLSLYISATVLCQPIDGIKKPKDDLIRPVHYVNDQVRDKRGINFQDDALDFYNENEELVDFIYPTTGESNYPDDDFFTSDLKFESTDDVSAPEGSGVESGETEGSGSEFESGVIDDIDVNNVESGLGETTKSFSKDIQTVHKQTTESAHTGKKSTCCLIE